jgi:hypothetical protein
MNSTQSTWDFADCHLRLACAKDTEDENCDNRPDEKNSKRMRLGDAQNVLPSEKT